MDETHAMVGRPTLLVKFSGRHEAEEILTKLDALGYPRDDVEVLLRPKGTDAVIDLVSGEPPAGQSGDARLLDQADVTTIVLLHPDEAKVDAIRSALGAVGTAEFEYSPQTVYSAADNAADVSGDEQGLMQQLRAETSDSAASVPASDPASDALRERITQVQDQVGNIKQDLENRGK